MDPVFYRQDIFLHIISAISDLFNPKLLDKTSYKYNACIILKGPEGLNYLVREYFSQCSTLIVVALLACRIIKCLVA